MSIAQLHVAGEGCDQPADLATLDQHAKSLWTCDATNLPWIVFRAAFRAAHMLGLSRRGADLLAALARTVDRTLPHGRIFINREKLSARARQSMRTLYRSLDDLEAAGLIRRPEQERVGEDYRFGRAYLFLTPLTIDRLGLGEKVSPNAGHERAKKNVSASPDSGPSATVADACKQVYLSPDSSQKRQPAGQMPADLQRLRSLGFHDFLIYRLMREARENGKRLSDVVEAVWEHLKLATHPICYLRKLLTKPVDFRFQVVRRGKETREAANEAQTSQAALETAHAGAGQMYVSFDGRSHYAVSIDGQTLTVTHAGEQMPRVTTHGWEVWFTEALSAGRLIRSDSRDGPGIIENTAGASSSGSKEACFAALKRLLPGRHRVAA